MNINKLMKQAQEMQQKMSEMQEKLANTEYEGSSGGGMVTVTITGKGTLVKLKVDPSIVDKEDVEMMEDLIVAAFNDAKKKADDSAEDAMSSMTGGLNLPPGFKLPF